VRHTLTGEFLKTWREATGLSQEAFGRKLGVSREWMGKLERGEREISAEIYLRSEALRKEPKFSEAYPNPYGMRFEERPDLAVHEAREAEPAYGNLDQIRRELRDDLEKTLRAAGDNRDRLGWMKVQMRECLSAPESWSKQDSQEPTHEESPPQLTAAHEKAIRANLRAEAEKKTVTHFSEKPQGIAGSSGS